MLEGESIDRAGNLSCQCHEGQSALSLFKD